jgi:hypothetical protein
MARALHALLLVGLIAGVTQAGIFKRRGAAPCEALPYGEPLPYGGMPSLRPFSGERITITTIYYTSAGGTGQTATYDPTTTYTINRDFDLMIEATTNYDSGSDGFVTALACAYAVKDINIQVNGTVVRKKTKKIHAKHFPGKIKPVYGSTLQFTVPKGTLDYDTSYELYVTDPTYALSAGPVLVKTAPMQ